MDFGLSALIGISGDDQGLAFLALFGSGVETDFALPLHRLVENFRLDAVDFREVGVENHALAAKGVNHRFDRNQRRSSLSFDGVGHGVTAGDADDAEPSRGVEPAESQATRSQTVTAWGHRILRSPVGDFLNNGSIFSVQPL
jgi:hypothetical protein